MVETTTTTTPTTAAAEQIPHYIPKDVYLPSGNSSKTNKNSCNWSSSFTTSSHNSQHEVSANEDVHHPVADRENDADNEDASSSWSLSTTSDLTSHSHGAIGHVPKGSPQRVGKQNDAVVQLAVEAAYKDLEGEKGGIELLAQELPATISMPPIDYIHEKPSLQDEEEEEEEPLFDPFQLHSEAGSIFTDYYSHAPVEARTSVGNGEENMLLTTVSNDFCAPSMTRSPGRSTDVVSDETPVPRSPSISTRSTSCTPSPRRRMMMRQQQLQRRHSDVHIASTNTSTNSNIRRKRRVFVPLHARMEMIQHQSQKPFRTVSRAIFGSVQKLHDRVVRPLDRRPMLKNTAISKSRRNVFRRKSKLDLAGYQCDEASVASSLPGLRNNYSEETGGTISLEYSQTLIWNQSEEDEEEEETVYPVQFLVNDASVGISLSSPQTPAMSPSRQSVPALQTAAMGTLSAPATTPTRPPLPPSSLFTPITPISRDEDGDLRWLFARQQLPLATPVNVRMEQQNAAGKEEKDIQTRHTLIHI